MRELEHLIGRAALRALAEQPQRPRILTLHATHLGLPAPASALATDAPAVRTQTTTTTLNQAVADLQRHMIEQSLTQHAGNWAAAARQLGLDRANLHRLGVRLGVR